MAGKNIGASAVTGSQAGAGASMAEASRVAKTDDRSGVWVRWRFPRIGRAYMAMICIVFSAVLFSATSGQLFHLDNAEFPMAARQTSVTGIPIYYHSEENARFLGIYHPPLYIYAFAAWIRAFGFEHTPVRMLGFVCALIQALLVLAIVRALAGRAGAHRIAPWFLALFLLNPYTLQSASILDIDNTIYGPILCGLLLCAIRMSWRDGQWRTDPVRPVEFVWLMLLLVLGFWAKLTTVLLFLAVVPLFLVHRLGWRRAIVYWTATAVAAMGIFGLTYWIYGLATGLDIRFTFRFTLFSFLNRGSSGQTGLAGRLMDRWHNFRNMLPVHVTWTGTLPWVAVAAAIGVGAWRGIRKRTALHWHIAMLAGLALAITLYYCSQTMTFGHAPFKYVYVCWGLVLAAPALLSLMMYGHVDVFKRARWGVVAVVFALAVVYGARSLHDDLIYGRANPVGKLVWFVPGLLAMVAIAAAGRWARESRALLCYSLTAYAGLSLGVAINQARAGYSTTYDYGQSGMEDAVAFIRSTTRPDDAVIAMKDIGLETGRRCYENYAAVYGDPAGTAEIKGVLAGGKAVYAVFTEGHGQDQLAANPEFKAWVEANSKLVRSYGDYRIYRPNSVAVAAAAATASAP